MFGTSSKFQQFFSAEKNLMGFFILRRTKFFGGKNFRHFCPIKKWQISDNWNEKKRISEYTYCTPSHLSFEISIFLFQPQLITTQSSIKWLMDYDSFKKHSVMMQDQQLLGTLIRLVIQQNKLHYFHKCPSMDFSWEGSTRLIRYKDLKALLRLWNMFKMCLKLWNGKETSISGYAKLILTFTGSPTSHTPLTSKG